MPGQKTTSPPPKGSAARAAEEIVVDVDEDEDSPFDRPTIIPTTPPDEFAGALAIGNDPSEDSVILRRGGITQPRMPAFEVAPSSAARGAMMSLGEEIDLWGGGSRVPPSAPPRSQMPTLAEADPLSFDLVVTAPPPTRKADDPEELTIPPHAVPGEFRFRNSSARTVPEPFARTTESPPGSVRSESASAPPSSGNARSRTGGGPLVEMRDRFALGDFTGALVLAEALLEQDSSNAEAARYGDNCRERLRQMYAARLGALDRVPRVIVPPDQVRWLSLDHRAGFVLSCVDGYSSIEEILDVSGMPALDALRVLYELLQQRIISVG